MVWILQNLLHVPDSSTALHGPNLAPSSRTGTSSLGRRLGALGIPIDDDDDDDSPGIDTEDEQLMLEYQLAQDQEFGRASLRGLAGGRATESDSESLAGNAPASLGKPQDVKEIEAGSPPVVVEAAGLKGADEEPAQPPLERHTSGDTDLSDQSFREIVSEHSSISTANGTHSESPWSRSPIPGRRSRAPE